MDNNIDLNQPACNVKRIHMNDILNNRFYQLPKFLFEEPFSKLSNDSKVLYALLRDRFNLSLTNNWINDKGEVYLLYTRANMQQILNLSKNTTLKAVNELIKYGLMSEERVGLNKANRIYLSTIHIENKGQSNSDSPDGQKLTVKKVNNCASEESKIALQESQIPTTNLTDFKSTDFNGLIDINQSIKSSGQDENNYSITKYSLDELLIHYGLDILDPRNDNDKFYLDIVKLIADELNKPTDFVILSKSNKIAKVDFESRVLKLNFRHFEYVKESFNNQTSKIYNVKSYLLTALYNSDSTIDQYYTNRVRSELG
ncbi:MAG: replication initiator protein A [Clostridia bacterium]|nr:replication initiator protein A [Clostridia bacterium]